MEEPFGMRPEEIAKLTDAQIVGLYGRERDKYGRPKKVGTEGRKFRTPEQNKSDFISMMKLLSGMTEQEAEEKWNKAVLKEV